MRHAIPTWISLNSAIFESTFQFESESDNSNANRNPTPHFDYTWWKRQLIWIWMIRSVIECQSASKSNKNPTLESGSESNFERFGTEFDIWIWIRFESKLNRNIHLNQNHYEIQKLSKSHRVPILKKFLEQLQWIPQLTPCQVPACRQVPMHPKSNQQTQQDSNRIVIQIKPNLIWNGIPHWKQHITAA